jgi:phospholipid/cholesterol/gamma-HCH transport system permease protein
MKMEMKSIRQDSPLTTPFAIVGRIVLGWVNDLGTLVIFLGRALVLIFQPKQIPMIIEQIYFIGAKSATIVMLVGLFSGMVLGLQMYHVTVKFGAEGVLGSAVALSLIRELGPVLTAVMIVARAGSSMTAELGILRISEQIDALDTMLIDPIRYLISPRFAATLISFPLLTAFFDLMGIIGGYFTGVVLLGVNPGIYFNRILLDVELQDITGGFVKSLVFAILVCTICCYQGFFTHKRSESRGARGVSLSTTSAVVQSCVLILIADYVVTSLLL